MLIESCQLLAILSAAAAAKGAPAIAASDRAQRTRNGMRKGAAPPLAAEAAETPKISAGIPLFFGALAGRVW